MLSHISSGLCISRPNIAANSLFAALGRALEGMAFTPFDVVNAWNRLEESIDGGIPLAPHPLCVFYVSE
jgi:hypothetical protein